MRVLLCEGFNTDEDGAIQCTGESTSLTLEEVQATPASHGLTKVQADALIGATLLALVTGFIFALIIRQLR